jgi:tetratricopeptide (TPR) repeat protein
MLDLTEAQLRRWEKQGLLAAGETYTFSDLIAVRALQKLRENGVPAHRIFKALESLKRKLSGIRQPLSELKIVSDGRTIAVQMAGERMEAVTGQLLFNFDTAALGGLKTLPAERPQAAGSRAVEAEEWFRKGLMLEETGAPVEEAVAAYRQALECNPAAAGASLNLGTILYRMRRFKDAEQHYRRAIEVDPRYALAHFNLGNLYDETGNREAAREHYQRAVDVNPGYADAHFNLALLCEKDGDTLHAVHHWKAYLKLDGAGAWADIARRQLVRLRDASIVRNGN